LEKLCFFARKTIIHQRIFKALEEGSKAERSAIENTQRAREGRERQEEIYEQFVRAEGMSKELNRGMLYSLLLVNQL
jgi:hypothetical protein